MNCNKFSIVCLITISNGSTHFCEICYFYYILTNYVIQSVTGSDCAVTDSIYDIVYDLSPLKSTSGTSCNVNLPDGDSIEFNICGPLSKNGNCANAGACLIHGDHETNIGNT